MDPILKREFTEVEKNLVFFDFHLSVLKIAERYGYARVIEILKANLETIESLNDETLKSKTV